ncbi:hypothetical protein H072_761 [Dactylellina haptotyla CBS 200.50]|uniref:HTH APSES-type domain-containing protein n=1 Tax=Dactylellina haptotyla (strain CBS 200.50) TaxID=1284197 RepID=S8CBY7_DACHA|nr:hypothetical protein H072_761 [Dactylellina haptotyla CBS 200.50]
MPDPIIYKATYSGVPVYEFLCKSIACMRRRSDGWLNATQILKVAGFDKPQRTRILEREVQKGVHEKVQGGYGKYQGTWVPLERGREIATQYKVEDLLDPIVNFRPTTESPPLAPKHITAASAKPRAPRGSGTKAGANPKKATKPPRVTAIPNEEDREQHQSEDEVADGNLSEIDGLESSLMDPLDHGHISGGDDGLMQFPLEGTRKRKRGGMMESPLEISRRRRVAYSDELLDYFMTNENGIPPFLENPPMDFEVNEIIDDEGHTAFHWAAAMGDLAVVELLLKAGADFNMTNKRGETPLMRAVLFTNNYDRKAFPRLVTILRSTIGCVDSFESTVFHHIAATTCSRNKLLAAKYYCNVILLKLSETEPQGEIGMLLDRKDTEGNTALTIAAKNSARKLVQMMLAYHGSPDIPNSEGHTADEYIVLYERDRRSMGQHNRHLASSSPVQAHDGHTNPGNLPGGIRFDIGSSQGNATVAAVKYALSHSASVPQPHVSEAAMQATQKFIPLMAEKLEDLASAYDLELREKEEDLLQARELLASVNSDLEATRAQYDALIATVGSEAQFDGDLEHARETFRVQSEALRKAIEHNQYFELARIVQEEEAKAIFKNKPTSAAGLEKEQKEQFENAKQLIKAQYGRNQLVEKIIELYALAGIGTRMNDYRKLISLALKVPMNEVDGLIPDILRNLQTEDSPLNLVED